jgi:hypothetical protein
MLCFIFSKGYFTFQFWSDSHYKERIRYNVFKSYPVILYAFETRAAPCSRQNTDAQIQHHMNVPCNRTKLFRLIFETKMFFREKKTDTKGLLTLI